MVPIDGGDRNRRTVGKEGRAAGAGGEGICRDLLAPRSEGWSSKICLNTFEVGYKENAGFDATKNSSK